MWLLMHFLILPVPCLSVSVAATVPASLLSLPMSYEDMALEQLKCPPVAQMQKPSSLTVPLSASLSLLGDMSTGLFCPLVPQSFTKVAFVHLHSLGHPGIRATRTGCLHLVLFGLKWPLTLAIRARQCVPCQPAKVHKHTCTPSTPILIPARRFAHMHLDLVGRPFAPVKGLHSPPHHGPQNHYR